MGNDAGAAGLAKGRSSGVAGVQELQEEPAVAAPRREKSEGPFCNS